MSFIGVDIGGTKALAVRVESGEVVASERFLLDRAMSTIDSLAVAVEKVADGDVRAIGVGIAGLVRTADGQFIWGPHVAGTEIPIGSELATRFGVPVAVDNDANAAAHAEFAIGAGAGYSNGLLVTLGTGIGGAIVASGEVYRGQGFAGEWGHTSFEQGGILCDCGRRGCWETRASGPALARLAREVVAANPDGSLARSLGDRTITGESVIAVADTGEETARSLVTEVGQAFGIGLSDLIVVLDPEIVVVGGGLGSVGESIIAPARRVVADSLHGGNLRIAPVIQVAALGESAGAVGAALIARERTNV